MGKALDAFDPASVNDHAADVLTVAQILAALAVGSADRVFHGNLDHGNVLADRERKYPALPEAEVSVLERSCAYDGAVPVFYGHYWREGTPTFGLDWTTRTACTDFSAVKRGALTAYRWSGETEIDCEHYVQAG